MPTAPSIAPASFRPLLFAALAALLLAALLRLAFPAGFTGLEARLADAAWRQAAVPAAPEQRVVIVDIDEASLAELGPWPWPRERMAALADALAAQGVARQIHDIVYADARSGDAAFAAALGRHGALVAELFAVEQGAPVQSGQPGRQRLLADCAAPFPAARGHLAPAAAFADLPTGHIVPRVGADGIVRAQPAYVCHDGAGHPALALAAYFDLAGLAAAPRLEAGAGWLAPPWQLVSPELAAPVPLDADGNLRIPYALPDSAILAVSAADLLAGRLPPGRLAGSVALVSSTAFGLGDVVATPRAGAQGGAAVHLQLLAGLLDQRLPHPPRAQAALQSVAAIAAVALLLALALAGRLPVYGLSLAGIVLALGLLGVQAWLQLAHGLLLGLVAPALAAALAGLFLGLVAFVRAGGERARLLAHLASYLPAPVAARLLAAVPQDDIAAERRDVTVLCADLRNFSAWCEAVSPDQAARLLHRFLMHAHAVATEHDGLVEAVQGDAILMAWNGSAPCADHAARALAAARELRRRVDPELAELHPERLPETASAIELPPLALGIGLDSGPALVGSLGPRGRRSHAVLGLPVTRAARLQALTADLAWPILAGPGLHERLAAAGLAPQGSFLLEGLLTPCVVYADTVEK